LEDVDEAEQLLAFAKSYLSASKVLCQRIEDNFDQAKYADGCVVIFTAYHAVELFLKAMIIKKNPNAKLHHDVEKLAIDYHRLYPHKNQYWQVPFGFEVLGDSSEAKKKFEDLKKELPVEQLYRYPINKNGKAWLGAFAFEPRTFMGTVILPVETDFQRLEKLVFA